MDFDSQYLIVTADGRLWQTVRQGDGTWLSLRSIQLSGQVGSVVVPINIGLGPVAGIVGVGVGYPSAEFLVVSTNAFGSVWQTVIKEDGTSSAINNISAIIGNNANVAFLQGGCVVDPFTSIYTFRDQNQHLWSLTHSTANNSWKLDNLAALGNTANSVLNATAAGASSAASQFLIVSSDGNLTFAERSLTGVWSGVVDVRAQFILERLPDPGPIGAAVGACADFQTSAAGFIIQTQWLLTTSSGSFWYAMRPYSQTPWTLYNLNTRLGIPLPPPVWTSATAAAGNGGTGSAFFCFTTSADGHLWWTKRLPDDTWVGVVAGTEKTDLTQMLGIPGAVIDVTITSQYAGIQPE